ncbi:MAG TPA: DNA primase [Minicystis sp.]|nr:DNA primase [Minicystis sp.]
MIRPDTIARVKERTDIVALVAESVRLTRRGRSFVGLCPFHKEKTPSFHVNPERGIFHCFGCKESGSAVDFVMKTEGHTFPEAIRLLADRAGVVVEDNATDAEQREAAAARRAKEDLYAVNHLAATFFEQCLHGGAAVKAHPLAHHAHAELARRGLVAPRTAGGAGVDPIADALQAFRVGYAPPGWDGLASFLKQQGVSPVTAERAGLLVPRSSGSGHYDRFRHRLMFAVTDVTGRVIAFSGRALDAPTADEIAAHRLPAPTAGDEERAPAKYINSPESPVYTKGEHLFGLYQARHAIRQACEAVLVEGNFDVVALHARGVGNVVAPLGTAFTPAQARLLKRFAPAVVVLFDGDAAGRKATRAARVPCREAGLDAKVAVLPNGVDPDELVRAQGREGLERVVKAARGMLEHLVDDALEGDKFAGAALTEQIARVRAVAALLAEEDDPNVRAMVKTYADRLSSKLIVAGRPVSDLRQLEAMLEQAVARPARGGPGEADAGDGPRPEPHDRARSHPKEERIPLEILGALLDYPELLSDPEVEDAVSAVEGDVALAVVALRQLVTGPRPSSGSAHAYPSGEADPGVQKGVYADEFLAQIAPSIHSFAVGRLASPRFELVGDAKLELLENARKLRRLSLLRENAAGVDQLHRAETRGDVASENALLLEIMRRAQKNHGLA